MDSVVPSRFQPRRVFAPEALTQLAASIRASGVMQPIAVRAASEAGGPPGAAWELVAGERRWRAAREAGLERIPALVVSLTDREAAEWGLAENVQREDLNPIETAHALRTLQQEFGLTQTQIGERVGLDRSSVANTLRLLDLERELQDRVASGALSVGHAKALLAAPTREQRLSLAKRAIEAGWSVRKLEALARAEPTGEGSQRPGGAPAPTRADPVREDLEKRLGESLGTRVHLKLHPDRKRGRIIIEFYDLDHFDSLLTTLGARA